LIEGLYVEEDEEEDSFNEPEGAAIEEPRSLCTPSRVHPHHEPCEFKEGWAITESQH
jgi:hypothetical protein